MHELDSLRESLLEGRLDRGAFLRKALGARPLAPGRRRAALRVGPRRRRRTAAADATPKRGGVLKFARNFEPVTLGPFGAADNGTIWTIMMIYDQLVEYQPGTLDPAAGSREVVGVPERRQDDRLPPARREVLERRAGDRRRRRVLAQPLQGSEGQQPAAVPRDEHRLDLRAEREDRRDEAEAARRRHPREPLRVPRLDHAEGGRDEARRQGVRAEARSAAARSSSTSWVRGQYLKMSRNPHYWRPGQPYLDGVEFDYITNDNTRILQAAVGRGRRRREHPVLPGRLARTRARRGSRSRRSPRSTRSG